MTFFSRTFDLLLINTSKLLLFGVYFSVHKRDTVCKYKLQSKPIIDTSRYTFSLDSDIDVEKSNFFHAALKFLINNF